MGVGHRFEYVAQAAASFESRGFPVSLLTTGAARQSLEYDHHIASCSSVAEVIVLSMPVRKALAAAQRLASGGVLVDLDADARAHRHLLNAVFRRQRAVLLLMRPPWKSDGHLPIAEPKLLSKALVWSLASRHPKRISTLVLGDCFGHSCGTPAGSGRRFKVVADKPVLHAGCNTRILQPGPKLCLLVVGNIDERKLVAELIAASDQVDGVSLALVGKVSESVRPTVEDARRRGVRVEVIDRFVSDDELDACIRDADLVSVILNMRSGSSGILGRAVSYGKPVVAGGNGTIVEAVSTHGIGAVAKDLSVAGIAASLVAAKDHFDRFSSNARKAQEIISGQMSLGESIAAATVKLLSSTK